MSMCEWYALERLHVKVWWYRVKGIRDRDIPQV